MDFFDCNCFIGLPAGGILKPARTAADLLAAMDRAHIGRAVVWHVAQRDYAVVPGNHLLAREIAPHRDRLVGCWSILPNQAGELPPPDDFFSSMADAGVAVLRVFPSAHKFLLRPESFGPILEQATARRIPLFLSVRDGIGWPGIYDLLEQFPELTAIIGNFGSWGTDRLFRPLLERYPNVHIDIADYRLDGGIQGVVECYGPRRLLFGSGFPAGNHGGMMLALKHAEISDEAKRSIAAGNLERILQQVRL